MNPQTNAEIERYVTEDCDAGKYAHRIGYSWAVGLACLAFRAGWRRGWCSARGKAYPDGMPEALDR